jgi:hypothetical protein
MPARAIMAYRTQQRWAGGSGRRRGPACSVGVRLATMPGPKKLWIFSSLHRGQDRGERRQESHRSACAGYQVRAWDRPLRREQSPHAAAASQQAGGPQPRTATAWQQHGWQHGGGAVAVRQRYHLWSHMSCVICSFLVRNSSTCRGRYNNPYCQQHWQHTLKNPGKESGERCKKARGGCSHRAAPIFGDAVLRRGQGAAAACGQAGGTAVRTRVYCPSVTSSRSPVRMGHSRRGMPPAWPKLRGGRPGGGGRRQPERAQQGCCGAAHGSPLQHTNAGPEPCNEQQAKPPPRPQWIVPTIIAGDGSVVGLLTHSTTEHNTATQHNPTKHHHATRPHHHAAQPNKKTPRSTNPHPAHRKMRVRASSRCCSSPYRKRVTSSRTWRYRRYRRRQGRVGKGSGVAARPAWPAQGDRFAAVAA